MKEATKICTGYDGIAEIYDELYADHKSLLENTLVRGMLYGFCAANMPVFDIGCGTGLALELLSTEVGAYKGVDLSPGMLEVARAKFPKHDFSVGDIRELPGGPRSNTLVLSLFSVMNYMTMAELVGITDYYVGAGSRFFYVLRREHLPEDSPVPQVVYLHNPVRLTKTLSKLGFTTSASLLRVDGHEPDFYAIFGARA